MGKDYHGVLPLDKPPGMTSFDVITQVKKLIWPDKRDSGKIGHGGTLDRLASGVLPILLGEATKAFDYLLEGMKTYEAIVRLGVSTDTDDADGAVTAEKPVDVSVEDINRVLPLFTGEIDQIPPLYSALKVDGKRASDRARKSQDVTLKSRRVSVYRLSLIAWDPVNHNLVLSVDCSSGTYIRSLARDIGAALHTGGHITALRRTRSAGINIKNCITLEALAAAGSTWTGSLIGLDTALSFMPGLELNVPFEHIINGKPLADRFFRIPPPGPGAYRASADGKLAAIVERDQSGRFRYLRVFHVF